MMWIYLASLGDWLGGLGEKMRTAGEWFRGFLDQWKDVIAPWPVVGDLCRWLQDGLGGVFYGLDRQPVPTGLFVIPTGLFVIF